MEKLTNHIYSLIPEREKVVVGFSGGADSCFLVEMLRKTSLEIFLFHLNHNIDEEWSRKSVEFTKEKAEKWGLPLKTIKEENLTDDTPSGIEAKARLIRYNQLIKHAEESGSKYILTAHNLNDAIETLLHNLFRGCGIHGLAPLRSKRLLLDSDIYLIRPLLEVSRHEIEEYLESNNIDYINDPSNESMTYTRNRIRHELIPLIKERLNPSIEATMKRFLVIAQQEEDFWYSLIERIKRTVTPYTNRENILRREEYRKINVSLAKRFLQDWIFRLTNGFYIGDYDFILKLDDFVRNGKTAQKFIFPRNDFKMFCGRKIAVLFSQSMMDELKFNEQKISCEETSSLPICDIVINDRIRNQRIFLPGRNLKVTNKNFLENKGHFLKKVFQENNVPFWFREYIPIIVDDNGEILCVGDIYIKYKKSFSSCCKAEIIWKNRWDLIWKSR
ncbi:MAG: tRNA lysidine(34) synthetase TilS [Candidatus Coatesbacteria bacterium]|nr:tRNA lysidine(34) synthetase TilS [Candidatus Coatesbacteria bacterium]